MSDEQPRPRYGEYAPGYTPGEEPPAMRPEDTTAPPPPSVPQYAPWGPPSGEYRPSVKPRNTGDLVVTIILLVLGLIGTLVGIVFGIALSDPSILDQAFRQQGFSFNGDPGAAPAVLIVSHVVLFLAAAGLSVLAIARRRIAFWIPLVAGVVAAFFFWGSYIAVLTSDPTFIQQLQQR